jgi:cytidyltransferase-like protein
VKPASKQVVVCGAFDDLRSWHIRFLEEAAKPGLLTVLLWKDESLRRFTGIAPKFLQAEREYFLRAIRFVNQVIPVDCPANLNSLPGVAGLRPDCWAVEEPQDSAEKKSYCSARDIEYRVIKDDALCGFPESPAAPPIASRKKVIVTGSYDWFHSGHVRFFEEASARGDLYVVVGHDANIRLLKGEGHPRFPQEERRYMVQSIRFVTEALISSGNGWLDAEPEIQRVKPDIYAVNEDGDKGGKREYCKKRGIEYLVLNRTPAPGLPRRSSTDLRGF